LSQLGRFFADFSLYSLMLQDPDGGPG